jgi:large subunit ribosomal protein L10
MKPRWKPGPSRLPAGTDAGPGIVLPGGSGILEGEAGAIRPTDPTTIEGRVKIMNRETKQQVVDSLSEQFRAVSNLFLIDYRGLKVVDATELRRKIREFDGSYVVVKNTLALRAARDCGLAHLEPFLQGTTAVAYHRRDAVGMAKLLTELSKANPNFQFKAALIEGKVIPASEIQSLASLPTREVLLGKLVFLLKAPLQRLAGVLKAPVRNLASALKQVPK